MKLLLLLRWLVSTPIPTNRERELMPNTLITLGSEDAPINSNPD